MTPSENARDATCTPKGSSRAQSLTSLVIGFALLAAIRLAPGSAAERPAVVELYTSEGCSSCPPAEALLEELSRRSDVVSIAFHVDYWDGHGWRDRFALPVATKRQQGFARALGLSAVGTPQMIIDGRRSVAGTNAEAVMQALSEPRSALALEARLVDGNLIVQLSQRSTREIYEVYVIGYLPQAVTPVPRGENAGRTLTEVNIVRSFRRIGIADEIARHWKIPVASFPKDASRALILLQRPAEGAIGGAISVDLR